LRCTHAAVLWAPSVGRGWPLPLILLACRAWAWGTWLVKISLVKTRDPSLAPGWTGFVTGQSKLWSRTAHGLSVCAPIRDWSNDTATDRREGSEPGAATWLVKMERPSSRRYVRRQEIHFAHHAKYSGWGSMMTICGIGRFLGKWLEVTGFLRAWTRDVLDDAIFSVGPKERVGKRKTKSWRRKKNGTLWFVVIGTVRMSPKLCRERSSINLWRRGLCHWREAKFHPQEKW